MGEPSSSAPPARQPSPSMLSIYLQRTSSGQLSTGTSLLRQQEAAGHLSLPVPSPAPSPRQLLAPQPPLPGGSLLSSPFYAHLRDSPQDLFPFGATSIPVPERPPSLTPPSQSSNDPPLGGAPTRCAASPHWIFPIELARMAYLCKHSSCAARACVLMPFVLFEHTEACRSVWECCTLFVQATTCKCVPN